MQRPKMFAFEVKMVNKSIYFKVSKAKQPKNSVQVTDKDIGNNSIKSDS